MPYTREKPNNAYSSEQLRERIPGWGVDLNPADRPMVPKEDLTVETGAHWDFPERQPEYIPREKSPEHKFLTPVFGTSCPPKGLSGAIRRRAYKHSEGQTMHWLMLMAADRIDVVESRFSGIASGHPDNVFKEGGLTSEITYHGIDSRRHQHRNDLKHQPIDYMMMIGTWVAVGAAAYSLTKAVSKGARKLR